MSQGYQIIATGHQKYLDMAMNCARSLKLFDPGRPIQLVTDLTVSQSSIDIYDFITPYQHSEYSGGPLVKLEMFDYAIFDETIFVDADCLMLNQGVDSYFKELSLYHSVACPGDWRSSGRWYGMDISEICSRASVDRVLKINSGAVFFKKDKTAKKFFSKAKKLYAMHGNMSGNMHKNTLTPGDEIYFSIAFEKCKLPSIPVRNERGSSLMISTLGSSNFTTDIPDGPTTFVKGKKHAPVLIHFIDLEPKDIYKHCNDNIQKIMSTETLPTKWSA